ncbi:glycosyltransferase family 2 protein [Kineococcus indalonis]|uniref:glycosyltransferase family 2 protein n=1 Tax=Kineococcus indalonis TaxID=2696566 RepID=UPI001412673F|nr:glycosyltransferase family 2 protein [Kineococcus indalonis]NAZ86417.1 hypothetical protein [Kineococcus indalonis]
MALPAPVSVLASRTRSAYWRVRYSRWGADRERTPGYSLVVPVPGDLPVFLDLALAVCREQSARHRVETLVVADVRTPEVDRIVADAAPTWPGPLRRVDLALPERVLLPVLRDPGRNHGAQLIASVREARGDHVVLHDADLFALDPQLHDQSYRRARDEQLGVLGVERAWDPWYAAHGRELAATWEQCSKVDWLRSVPPHRHLGHDARLWGERHTFDTTFWAQCRTDPRRIAVSGRSDDIVHFNYVISTYRRFQRQGRGGGFRDGNLRLLLIRVFIDVFGRRRTGYDVPELATLRDGLRDASAPVTYAGVDPGEYAVFRRKLTAILEGPWTSEERRRSTEDLLGAFDEHFGSSPAPAAGARVDAP